MTIGVRAWIAWFVLLLVAAGIAAGCATGDDDDSAPSSDSDDDTGGTDDDADDDADDDSADDDTDDDTIDEAALLEAFQPLLVQKTPAEDIVPPYPPEDDWIGSLSLGDGTPDFDYTVRVDTDDPVMYHFAATAQIRGRTYTQLLYAFFYPERPLLATFAEDPLWWLFHWFEQGAIDGKVVRVTLDQDNATPLLIEVMQSCGCGWQLFVNHRVDEAAAQEYADAGIEYPGLTRPDAPHDVPYVWIMPEDAATDDTHTVVMDEAGWTDSAHHILGAYTSFEQWLGTDAGVVSGLLYRPADLVVDIPDPTPLVEVDYDRLPYDPLYTLKPEGSEDAVGIFDEYGYIWNSYSPFYLFMRDHTDNVEFPGTPRDPAAFEVVHETIDFWDQETLFERFIYLPESIFGKDL